MAKNKLIHAPDVVLQLLNTLITHNFNAYLVGGCVRDNLIGQAPKDWDITTNATSEQVTQLFPNDKIIETGLKHNTITLVRNNMPIEITTFRADSIEDDLNHRDFTMNTIAWNPYEGIVDPFNGVKDIKKKLIRATENANDRFQEDGLRILRAMRFASVFDWRIEDATSQSMHNNAKLLQDVSIERVKAELVRFLCGIGVYHLLIDYRDILAIPIPELVDLFDFDQCNSHHTSDLWDHTAIVVSATEVNSEALRLAALFHDIGKPSCFTIGKDQSGHFYSHPDKSAEMTAIIMKRLRFDNDLSNRVTLLVRQHESIPWIYLSRRAMRRSIRRIMSRIGIEATDQLLDLRLADIEGHAIEWEPTAAYYRAKEVFNELQKEQACFTLKDLAVNGHDLIQLGYNGKAIGSALKFLLLSVIDEKIANEKHILLDSLRNWRDNK